MNQDSQPLPSKHNDIDWDTVCKNYHDYILSPFAPCMTQKHNQNTSRNLLLNHLLSIPEASLAHMNVIDLGCGPGNLIPHLAGRVKKLVGVDASPASIEHAKQIAEEHGENNFLGLHCNILDLNTDTQYDLVISSNAILPKTRDEVVALYRKVHALLKPNGLFLAILPSFDTTLYLRSLWQQHYREQGLNKDDIISKLNSFNQRKKLDEVQLAYADDGLNSQCYHTPTSIITETQQAGLQLIRGPSKLYYPWELCARFDYGYFPNADEEIWDWFIAAGRA